MESFSDVIDYFETNYEEERKDEEIMAKWGFKTLDEITLFINKYRDHVCHSKPISYLTHDELMNNNYYSQLINSCYIINKQLDEKSKKCCALENEVIYFRKLYINDEEKRNINRLLDSNHCLPPKVTLNKAYYDKYFNLLINKKDEKIKTKSNKFVLYSFKNIVNRVIYKNKKQRFINKIKDFITCMNTFIENRRPKKVGIGDALYKKYKKQRILNNFNKFKIVKNKIILINRIKKYISKYRKQKRRIASVLEKNKKIIKNIIDTNNKYKKYSVYDRLYQSNRNTIDLYSDYYNDYVLNNKKDEIKLIQHFHDKNSSRFLRMLDLFNLIKKDENLYNSKYIFNYYKLSEVNIKDNNYNNFLTDLKNALGLNNSSDCRNHKVTLGDALYVKYHNKFLEKDENESIYSYSEFIKTCVFCQNTNDIDETNGICSECTNNMNKTCSSDYEDF